MPKVDASDCRFAQAADDAAAERIQAVIGHDVMVWIDAAWAAILIRQGIIPERHAATVAEAARMFLQAAPPGYAGFGALKRYVCEHHGAAVGDNLTSRKGSRT